MASGLGNAGSGPRPEAQDAAEAVVSAPAEPARKPGRRRHAGTAADRPAHGDRTHRAAEKLTLFWHGFHFATSVLKVRDPYLMWQGRPSATKWDSPHYQPTRDY